MIPIGLNVPIRKYMGIAPFMNNVFCLHFPFVRHELYVGGVGVGVKFRHQCMESWLSDNFALDQQTRSGSVSDRDFSTSIVRFTSIYYFIWSS